MIIFESGLDYRTREQSKPTVAKIRVSGNEYAYCIIGTEYGHIHTTSGDVRTWKTASGAYRFLKNYKPF